MSSIPVTTSVPDLSPSQRAVLATLVEFPETTVKALAAAAGVGNSTAAAALRLLENHQLAMRIVSPLEDKRPRPADIWSAGSNAAAVLMTPVAADSAEDAPSGPIATELAPEPDPEQPIANGTEAGYPLTLQDDTAGPGVLSLRDTNAGDEAAVATPTTASHPTTPTAVDAAEAGDSDAERLVSAEPSARLGKGALREAVLDHLRKHPDTTFTPTALSKALTRSSGAISNALDALVATHDAALVCEKPRTFQAAPAAS